ncbi:AMP-binding protein [Actinocorallia sp. API 0066]|uniref:protein kinase family protein n=1 Tax=Actinocorallia sp. API 0066 TaxID=2896846 RepID=UPI001E59A0F6|nr:protein kinase family protein [Actinocorallia sp. API 0066]MCD0452426.1 AMP-binding protein [Actinocorallia sp. API 0066]
MSTSVIEPGTRLAGRYRLEEQVSESGGSTLWKAIDEILARAVAVRTFAPDFPRAAEVVTAARTASRLTDPRLTQVFDADDTGELAYVVSEWVSGETLEQMILKDGPLAPGRAARFVSEAAEALASAHTAGMSHLCLTARDLVWTTGGTVKLTGLGVDAVLGGVTTADPARLDALGLGQMLYAALTGHWPGGAAESSLPVAPDTDGEFTPPRELRGDVPAAVDAIVCRAMELAGATEPLTTPGEVAAALTEVPRTPLPLFAGLQSGPPPSVINRPRPAPAEARTVPAPRPASPTRTARLPEPPVAEPAESTGRKVNGPLVGAAALGAAIVIGVAAWALGGDDSPTPQPSATATEPAAPAGPGVGPKLPIAAAEGLQEVKPEHPGHDDNAVGPTAGKIKDGKNSTFWETQKYSDTIFGNYLNGVGVRLTLSDSAAIGRVTLNVPATGAGAPYLLYIGDAADRAALSDPISGTLTAGKNEIAVPGVTGRYVILWFPKGPPSGKLQVGEATVFGTG